MYRSVTDIRLTNRLQKQKQKFLFRNRTFWPCAIGLQLTLLIGKTDLNITNHGKYLGFSIGLDAGKHNWSSPISKYKQRSREIHVAALPAAFSASEYNTKCLPTILYVSQLCPPPPHPLQTELGAIHKIWHLPPQAVSYNLAINFGPIAGFSVRSACPAMNASMIRFALKSFRQANEVNTNPIQATLDSVAFCFLSNKPGTLVNPGWDSLAHVSYLTAAMQHNNRIGIGLPEFAAYMKKVCRRIERNCPIQEVAIQKQLYSMLSNSIPNGWKPLVSKRLAAFGADSPLIHDSFELFKLKPKMIQPHLRMSFVKTLTNGWQQVPGCTRRPVSLVSSVAMLFLLIA